MFALSGCKKSSNYYICGAENGLIVGGPLSRLPGRRIKYCRNRAGRPTIYADARLWEILAALGFSQP
jgi:hypothetical protein